jgi:hypothetical protein
MLEVNITFARHKNKVSVFTMHLSTCPNFRNRKLFVIYNSMFNRSLAFPLNMSENLELCPKCKQGHLRDTGDAAVKVEIQPPFRQPGSSMRERICDHCGHRQIDQYLNEYGEAASDLLSGRATKANQEDKREE